MRLCVVASLAAASALWSPDARAASPVAAYDRFDGGLGGVHTGTFAGARLRIALGGSKVRPKPQLNLTLAPMVRMQALDGRTRMRFGEGVSFALNGNGPARLALAGRPLSGFAPQKAAIDKTGAAGVSTLGWVGIGAGALLVVGVVYYAVLTSECYECDD